MKRGEEYKNIVEHFGGKENFRIIFKGAENFDIPVAKVFKYLIKIESYDMIDDQKNFKETKVDKPMSRSTFQRRKTKVLKGLPRD